MRSISEISSLTGVSQRTLHYYDEIGLLRPSKTTEAGYRFYDDDALERLRHILLFRELNFPLKEIQQILDSPDFDRISALEQQIELLTLKKQHLENLIDFANGIRIMGTNNFDFTRFNTRQIDEYASQARANWGKAEAYQEYEQRFLMLDSTAQEGILQSFLALLSRFGTHLGEDPASPALLQLAEELHTFISQHFYTCTPEIFYFLANMYDGGGAFTRNINKVGGEGTASLAAQAIRSYLAMKSA